MILLEGSDEFLKLRVKDIPEDKVLNTHYNEEGMNRRLGYYKNINESSNG